MSEMIETGVAMLFLLLFVLGMVLILALADRLFK